MFISCGCTEKVFNLTEEGRAVAQYFCELINCYFSQKILTRTGREGEMLIKCKFLCECVCDLWHIAPLHSLQRQGIELGRVCHASVQLTCVFSTRGWQNWGILSLEQALEVTTVILTINDPKSLVFQAVGAVNAGSDMPGSDLDSGNPCDLSHLSIC